MIAAVVSTLVGGAVILGVVVGWRWLDARAWRRSLVAIRLQFPRGLKADSVSAWLGMLGALRVPIALEVVATRQAIAHYLLVPKARQAEVLTGTRALLPGLRLEDAPGYLAEKKRAWQTACELRITHLSHQLAADRAETAAAAFLGSLGQLQQRETVMVQWLVVGVATPGPRAASDQARVLAQAEKLKHAHPLLQAVGRIAVQSPARGRAGALLSRISGTLRLLDTPGAAVVRRSFPYFLAQRRLENRSLPVTVWPLAINVGEAAGLVGVPLNGSLSVPGLVLGRSRQLPPGQVPSNGGTAIAVSNYPGRVGQPLVLRPNDRLHHVYVVGPTGVGKSNLLAQMAIADAGRGSGLALIDPKGDLVEAVLERLPDAASERVILLDPSQTDTPVGFNPLQVQGSDEHARELAADRVLHVFKELYRANWGPRSDDLLRAALLTLVNVPAPNGQAFTICEIPELLVRPALRRYAVNSAGLPEALKTYWSGFDALSEAEQQQHTAPVMNKLRAFTMLPQSD